MFNWTFLGHITKRMRLEPNKSPQCNRNDRKPDEKKGIPGWWLKTALKIMEWKSMGRMTSLFYEMENDKCSKAPIRYSQIIIFRKHRFTKLFFIDFDPQTSDQNSPKIVIFKPQISRFSHKKSPNIQTFRPFFPKNPSILPPKNPAPVLHVTSRELLRLWTSSRRPWTFRNSPWDFRWIPGILPSGNLT